MFGEATRAWFTQAFPAPTPAQASGWPAIASGEHVLIQAPTGSGKTLAAFLYGIDRLTAEPGRGLRLLYVSPLKALNYDVERNLRGPLAGLRSDLRVAVRTGDTPQKERAALLREPAGHPHHHARVALPAAHVAGARDAGDVETVIVDEVHAVAGTKRGAHLALSLERLDALRRAARAAHRPLRDAAPAGGDRPLRLRRPPDPARRRRPPQGARPAGRRAGRGHARARLHRVALVPRAGRRTARWTPARSSERARSGPPSTPRCSSSSAQHRSTIVFVNNRRLAERLALRLNELAEEEVGARPPRLARARAARARRGGAQARRASRASSRPRRSSSASTWAPSTSSCRSRARSRSRAGCSASAARATSSAPSRRAASSRSSAATCSSARSSRGRCATGEIEETKIPRNPLDVLAQQIVADLRGGGGRRRRPAPARARRLPVRRPLAHAARERARHAGRPLPVRRVRRAAAAHRLGSHRRRRSAAATGARRLAVANAGHDPRPRPLRRLPVGRRRPRRRARRGDGLRGARRPDVPARRVDVAHRGDHARPRARLPRAGRARARCRSGRARAPAARTSSGEAIGARVARARRAGRRRGARAPARRALARRPRRAQPARATCASRSARPASCRPTGRSSSSASATRSATGASASCRRSAAACTRRGRWRSAARLRDALGLEAQALWSDDGIVLHLPDADAPPPLDELLLDPDEVEELVVARGRPDRAVRRALPRERGRALLIPRRRPGQRTPLWQQRLKAQSLLQVARRYGSFPIVLETYRECLQDVFDLPALRDCCTGCSTRELDLVDVETPSALAVRLVAALRLRRDVHLRGRHAAGRAPRAGAVARPRSAARAARPGGAARAARPRRARRGRGVSCRPRPRSAGRAPRPAAAARRPRARASSTTAHAEPLLEPSGARSRVRIAGEERLIAAEDAGRYRDALGVMPPGGLPDAFLEAGPDALRALVLPLRARARAVHDRASRARFALRAAPSRPSCARSSATTARARRAAAGRHASASGATPTCCGACAAPRWPRCAARSRPSSRPRSAASCRSWHGDRPPRDAARGARAAPGAGPACLALGVGRAAAPRAGLPARAAGRAVRLRRGRLGRRRPRPRGRLLPRGRAAARPAGRPATRPRARRTTDSARRWAAAPSSGHDLLVAAELDAGGRVPALWELVWAGEVTNDAWAPLRAAAPLRHPDAGRARAPLLAPARRRSTATRAAGRPPRPLFAGRRPTAARWPRSCSSGTAS